MNAASLPLPLEFDKLEKKSGPTTNTEEDQRKKRKRRGEEDVKFPMMKGEKGRSVPRKQMKSKNCFGDGVSAIDRRSVEGAALPLIL